MSWLTKLFLKTSSKKHLTNSNSGKNFEDLYNDLGAFTYLEGGFIVTYEAFNKSLKWTDITEINVYKVDLMTFDRIEMEIVYGEKCFTINEELPGWYQFVLKTKEIFPTIPKDWDSNIIFPAFATNYATIFRRE